MSHYGMLVIKPDARKEGLEENIQNDIINYGFEIVYIKEFQFRLQHLFLLGNLDESEGKEDQILEFMRNYKGGKSIVLIVKSQNNNCTQEVLKIKGKIDEGGIRQKYLAIPYEELMSLEFKNPKEFNYYKARNRVHSPNDEEHLIQTLKEVFTYEEYCELRKLGWDIAIEFS